LPHPREPPNGDSRKLRRIALSTYVFVCFVYFVVGFFSLGKAAQLTFSRSSDISLQCDWDLRPPSRRDD
jgi:hypothetical protein